MILLQYIIIGCLLVGALVWLCQKFLITSNNRKDADCGDNCDCK